MAARISRGANDYGTYLNRLLDQLCEAANRSSGGSGKGGSVTLTNAYPLYNNGTVSFTVGLIGGYNASGQVVLASASGTAPIAARFVSVGVAGPQAGIPVAVSGLAAVQVTSPPAKRGVPAWLSPSTPGKATATMPASGYKQFLGVFDTQDAKTGLWSVVLLIDTQMIKGVG